MEEFPPNSKRQKEESPPAKKIEPVVTGSVVRRKAPAGKRLASMIVGGDLRTVWEYVIMDVLVPAAKDMIVDATTQGFEKMIFGDTGRRRSLTPRTPSVSNTGYISYNRFAPSSVTPARTDERRSMSRRPRGEFDFDDILLATKIEADVVVDRLFDIINQYEQASVRDLYEILGLPSNYTDDKWGWTDIRGISVKSTRAGYLLDLPRPEVLNPQ